MRSKLVVNVLTTNEGKAKEFRLLGNELGVEVRIIRYPKLEVQGNDLESIALTSAIIASQQLGMPLVVEDAGLFIRALNWFPGPYSSYVFKTIGIKGILKLMSGINDRYAYFKSVITYVNPKLGIAKVFKGITEGSISNEPRGTSGFGFDPIFIPKGMSLTYAEMGIELKNRYSHRSKAFRELIKWLRSNL